MTPLSDTTEAIGALSDAEFLARLDEMLSLSTRTRAFAARRWVMLMWPGQPPEAHQAEGLAAFRVDPAP